MNNINSNYFITIVQEANLNKAAKKLFVSQPSLSQYLKRLEKKLGVELFDHKTSPLTLTFAGKRYYEYVLQAKSMEENIHNELIDISHEMCGCIRLGVPFWRGACILPQVLPSFYKDYPQIKLELLEKRAALLMESLIENDIDLVIVNIPTPFDFSSLIYDVIFEERLLLAVSIHEPLVQEILASGKMSAGYPTGNINLLSKLPIIMGAMGQNSTFTVNSALHKHHIKPNILLETANLTTAINLVEKGMGCAFVPEAGAEVCHRPGSVIYLSLDLPELVWPLAVVYKKDFYLPKRCQLFIDAVKNNLQKNRCTEINCLQKKSSATNMR